MKNLKPTSTTHQNTHPPIYNQVIQDFTKTNSIKETAKNLSISTVKTRKILITAKCWRSKTSDEIGKLYESGYTVAQIAEKLFMTHNNVQAYIPYSRGQYGEIQSDTALRSEGYRIRMRIAADGQVGNITKREGIIMNKEIQKKIMQEAAYASRMDDIQGTQKAQDVLAEQLSGYRRSPSAIKLHLEIINTYLSDEQVTVLRNYGKVEGNAISRDIIVPSVMTLHALHYAIQKLFGWQNSHLRNYSLPEEHFQELTGGRYSDWTRLCGILFRYPSNNEEDMFWDDDYEEGESFKTWIMNKYIGPYSYHGFGDYYIANVIEINEFNRRFPKLDIKEGFDWEAIKKAKAQGKEWHPRVLKTVKPDECTLDEIGNCVYFAQNFNYLLERLSVAAVFSTKPISQALWLERIHSVLEKFEAAQEEGIESFREIIGRLGELLNTQKKFDGLKAKGGQTPGIMDVFKRYQAEARALDRMIDEFAEEYEIAPMPLTKELIYSYDYGDNWKVTITCVEEYYDQSRYEIDGKKLVCTEERIVDSMGKVVEDPDVILSVINKNRPACIWSDGLPVLDDVGGMHGYCEFLSAVKDGDTEMREWGRSLGWTGRMSKPERML